LQKYSNINSKLYAHLFQEGGDSLIAVYALLKSAKRINGKVFKEQNRNIYHTLKTETNLSISTLRKYIKVLTKENLCYFDSIGNFCLVGGNKINKQFNSKKIVPIEIGTYKETKLFSFRVRVISMEQQQKNIIDRRHELNKVNGRELKGYRLSQQEINFMKSWKDSDLNYLENKESYCAKTVLSNQGYSKLKFGETKSKGSGYYWKKKLVSAGIIKVRRKFKYIKKCSYKEYRQLKFNVDISLVYIKGRLFKELIPEFTTTDFPKPPKEEIKKLDYLQFDFCHFLANEI
jgi:hypothetical protein